MKVEFIQFNNNEKEEIADFLTSEKWIFHGSSIIEREKVYNSVEKGLYNNEETQTFWIIVDNKKAGLLKLFDLEDLTPLFDIRIKSEYRSKGIGEKTVNWLIEYIFNNFENIHRIEGTTRVDNIPMRKVFKKCGFVKEGHHRKSWDTEGMNYNDFPDAVAYGILRDDWKNSSTTKVNWDDENF